MARTLGYNTAASALNYINLARDLSRLESKNEEITTRDGHVKGYLVDIKCMGGSLSVYTAPNSWKMRNSFRKFHAYRELMFEEAGIEGDEIGRYGKTIRPYLDVGHLTNAALTPFTSNSVTGAWNVDGGEWTMTRMATTPIYGESGGGPAQSAEKWADGFDLHICEENQFQIPGDDAKSGMYSSVGMIHSYNLDRQELVTPDINSDQVLESPSNPLAAIRSNGNQAAGAVLDIAIDQEAEAPPYDLADNGDSIQVAFAGSGLSTAEFPTQHVQCFVPAGLMRIDTGSATATLQVKVLDTILCKDME
jgi:hypothetical protein